MMFPGDQADEADIASDAIGAIQKVLQSYNLSSDTKIYIGVDIMARALAVEMFMNEHKTIPEGAFRMSIQLLELQLRTGIEHYTGMLAEKYTSLDEAEKQLRDAPDPVRKGMH